MRRGFLAAAVFIAWFLLVDVVKQQPLFTLAYLSGLLFSFTTALPATARVIVLVLVLFLIFGAIGMLAARFKRTAFLALVTATFIFVFFVGIGTIVFRVNVLRTLGWAEFVTGCLLAGVSFIAPPFARRDAK